MTMQLEEVKQIQDPSLYDFLKGVIQASNEGYSLSEKNEYFPQNLFTIYTCTMTKPYETKKGTRTKKEISNEE